MREIVVHLGTANSFAILTAIVGLIVILAAQKYIPKIPGALLGLLVSTFIAVLFFKDKLKPSALHMAKSLVNCQLSLFLN